MGPERPCVRTRVASNMGDSIVWSPILAECDAVLEGDLTGRAEAKPLANWVALHKLRSRETDLILERRTE